MYVLFESQKVIFFTVLSLLIYFLETLQKATLLFSLHTVLKEIFVPYLQLNYQLYSLFIDFIDQSLQGHVSSANMGLLIKRIVYV